MAKPIRASEIAKERTATDPELLKQRARRAVGQRQARRTALESAGHMGDGTPGHIDRIDERASRAADDRMAAFRARQRAARAVAERLKERNR
jgi:hypothetical protein